MSVTALADVKNGVVRAEVEIAAPPKAVFRALTEPAELGSWWGSADLYQTRNWVMDLRVGGKWRAEAIGADGGDASIVRGEVLELDPPRLLSYSWEPSWDGFVRTIVRYELTETPRGTKVQLTHRGFAEGASLTDHAQGWERVLGWLEAHPSGRSR